MIRGLSVMAQVRVHPTPTTGARLISKRGTSGPGWEIGIGTWPATQMVVSDGTITITAPGPDLLAGYPTWVAGVYSRTRGRIRVSVSGVEVITAAAGLGDCSNALPVRLFAGAEATPSRFADAVLHEARIYGEALTPNDLARVTGQVRVLTFDGDSQTAIGSASSLPNLVKGLLTYSPALTNAASGGDTLTQMRDEAPATVDTTVAGSLSTVVVWGGTNDLYYGATANATMAVLVDYVTARLAAGFRRVVVVTTLPRTTAGQAAGYETERLSLNAQIRAYAWPSTVRIADPGGHATIGFDGAQNNATYFLAADTTHLTTAGRQIVAPLIVAGLPA